MPNEIRTGRTKLIKHRRIRRRKMYTRQKKRKQLVQPIEKPVLHENSNDVEDTPDETPSRLPASDDMATTVPNNESTTSTKTSNGFHCILPWNNGNLENNFPPKKATKDLFDRLFYSEEVLSLLPNRTWAIHSTELPERRVIVSAVMVHNLRGTGLEPFYIKQIVFDEKLNFDLHLINARIVLKDKPTSIETMHDFEGLVDYIDSLKLCAGGPDISQYSNVTPECAYKDPLNKWRHNLCTLEVDTEDVCESCLSLDEILRRCAQRIKPPVKLRNSPNAMKRKNRSKD